MFSVKTKWIANKDSTEIELNHQLVDALLLMETKSSAKQGQVTAFWKLHWVVDLESNNILYWQFSVTVFRSVQRYTGKTGATRTSPEVQLALKAASTIVFMSEISSFLELEQSNNSTIVVVPRAGVPKI